MAKHVIKMSLSTASIENAIRELKSFRDSLKHKMDKLLKELADIGLEEATLRFTGAMYDRETHTDIEVKSISNGYVIVASGKDVAFIEFGAGIHYNEGKQYPGKKPDGIVDIGQYGKGYGSRHAWGYTSDDGNLVITRGNPAAMPMWYASEEMRSNILKIAKEVFG